MNDTSHTETAGGEKLPVFRRSRKTGLVFLFVFLAALIALPEAPYQLRELTTGEVPPGFSVEWPALRLFLEPFYGFSHYLVSLDRFSSYQIRFAVVMLWLTLPVAAATFARRRSVFLALHNTAFVVLLACTAISCSLLIPFPGPRLAAPERYRVFDPHSHTYYSRDSVKSPAQSLAFHDWSGFDAFFVAEHSNSLSFARFAALAGKASVSPGMQRITNQRGMSLLFLSDVAMDDFPDEKLDVEAWIRYAKSRGCLVVFPHWWKWRGIPFERLLEMGIDGFEIYNMGYKNISPEERRGLIEFCRKNDLLMFGATDWHGWGSIADVWNVVETTASERGESLFSLLKRGRMPKVLVYDKEERRDSVRLVFEPFFGLYSYVTSLEPLRRLCLFFWVCVLLVPGGEKRQLIRKWLPFILGVAFAAGAAYYAIVWKSLGGYNAIIPGAVLPILAVLSAGWFAHWHFGKKYAVRAYAKS